MSSNLSIKDVLQTSLNLPFNFTSVRIQRMGFDLLVYQKDDVFVSMLELGKKFFDLFIQVHPIYLVMLLQNHHSYQAFSSNAMNEVSPFFHAVNECILSLCRPIQFNQ